jgi:hypothetical protein
MLNFEPKMVFQPPATLAVGTQSCGPSRLTPQARPSDTPRANQAMGRLFGVALVDSLQGDEDDTAQEIRHQSHAPRGAAGALVHRRDHL